jgi:hypothetical protein
MNNSFAPQKFQDFKIVAGRRTLRTVGHIRVKPSGVLWAPKDAKVWYGVSLAKFAAWIEQNGQAQDK